jgi:hypothetical protein
MVHHILHHISRCIVSHSTVASLQASYNNPNVRFPLQVDLRFSGNEIHWTDGSISRVITTQDGKCIIEGREGDYVHQLVVRLVCLSAQEHYKVHVTEVLEVVKRAPEKLGPAVEQRLLRVLSDAGEAFALELITALPGCGLAPAAASRLVSKLVITGAIVEALLNLTRACAQNFSEEELIGASGLLQHLSVLLRVSGPLRMAGLTIVLHVLQQHKQLRVEDVEAAGIQADLMLDILDEPEEIVPAKELLEVLTQTFYSSRAVTRERLIPLLQHTLAPQHLPSQGVLVKAVDTYGSVHNGLESLLAQRDEHAVALAGRLVEFLAWAIQDPSALAPGTIQATAHLLSSVCRQLPKEVASLLGAAPAEELLAGLGRLLLGQLREEESQPLLLLWLQFCLLADDESVVRWGAPLCEANAPYLLRCSWEDQDLMGFIEKLHHKAPRGGSEASWKAAQQAYNQLVSAMLTAHRDATPAAGLRCLNALVRACSSAGRTRPILVSCLKDKLPAIIPLLRLSDVDMREGAAKLISLLLELSDKERRILLEAYGSGSQDGLQGSTAAACDEGALDGTLFLLSDLSSTTARDAPRVGTVEAEHFDRVAKMIEPLLMPNSNVTVDGALGIQESKSQKGKPPSGGGLVLTPTTLENLRRVVELSRGNAPILLEGDTGVGKSATIMAAAEMASPPQQLVRFNMSRTVTIDELLGQVTMGDGGDFIFVKQPFTVAFETGCWLLLDEINLAQDNVLQCIEEAIDTGMLVIKDSSSASSHVRKIVMHENFRLFATQNPNSGFFKVCKREVVGFSADEWLG